MALKDLLVHVAGTAESSATMDAALALAGEHDAHLIGLGIRAPLGIPAYTEAQLPDTMLKILQEREDQRLAEARQLFESKAKSAGRADRAEWRTDMQLGNTTRLFSEFYQPLLATGEIFVAPYINLERRQQSVYEGDNRVAQYSYRDNYAGIDLGSQMRGYGEMRLGVSGGELRPELSTGSVDLIPQASKISTGGTRFQVIFDQLDSTIFPRDGWSAIGYVYDSSNSLGADIPYTKWSASSSYVRSFGNNTFNVYAKVGGRIGDNPIPGYDMFQWGGFMQQSGYATGQLLGEEITFGRLMYYRRVLHSSLFEGAYVGVSLESGKIGKQPVAASEERKDWLNSMSIFVGADSPLGPAYLGYGRSSEGNNNIYFYLGRPY